MVRLFLTLRLSPIPRPAVPHVAGEHRRRRADTRARESSPLNLASGPLACVAGQRGLGPQLPVALGELARVHLAAKRKMYPEIKSNENFSELVKYIEK